MTPQTAAHTLNTFLVLLFHASHCCNGHRDVTHPVMGRELTDKMSSGEKSSLQSCNC